MLQLKLDGCMLGINNRDLGTFKVDLHNNKVIMDSAAGQQVSACRDSSIIIWMACTSAHMRPVIQLSWIGFGYRGCGLTYTFSQGTVHVYMRMLRK